MISRPIYLVFMTAAFISTGLAQGLSDTEIEAAMKRGAETTTKKLWADIKKKQQFRINRAGLGDPIEKKITV